MVPPLCSYQDLESPETIKNIKLFKQNHYIHFVYPRQFFTNYWRPEIKQQCFVIMSFKFDGIFKNIFEPSIKQCGIEVIRSDTHLSSDSIMSRILNDVSSSKIILADISTEQVVDGKVYRNQNAMYEVGLAHAIRQPEEVILVRHDKDRLSFDIQGINVHTYDVNNIEQSRKQISGLIQSSIESINFSKSLLLEKAINNLNPSAMIILNEQYMSLGFTVHFDPTMGGTMSVIRYSYGISCLLELGILVYHPRSDSDSPNMQTYAWTDFGKEVIFCLKKNGVIGQPKTPSQTSGTS